jgi:hypothetical protein
MFSEELCIHDRKPGQKGSNFRVKGAAKLLFHKRKKTHGSLFSYSPDISLRKKRNSAFNVFPIIL